MPRRILSRLGNRLKRFWRNDRGAAALLFAFAIVPLVGAAGLAIDSSLAYVLRSRMSKSLDTAALAAGRIALNANAGEVAREYFDANFGGVGSSATITDFSFELDDTRQFVTLTAVARTPTKFMRIFGQDEVIVSARSVVRRQTTGLELALVMDNTGSMWGAPFTAMQVAAFDLVDIMYGGQDEIENLWVSLVPYTATVNIGPHRIGWLAAGDRVLTDPGSFSTEGWKGCVMARATPLDTDDSPPSEALFDSFFYASTPLTGSPLQNRDNNWPPLFTSIADQNLGSSSNRNTARGPNVGCGAPVTPLTASRAVIDAAIGAMGPIHRGGTTGNLGLTWGWRTLSPRWRGLWGGATPAALPLDYHTPLMEKVVVLLTDGNNQFHDQDTTSGTPRSDFTAYGRLEAMGVTTLAQGRNILDARQAATCTAMKAEGIIIYSIIFGAAPDAQAQNLFRNCATTPGMYYYAPNNATLAAAFKAIGGQLANLRIVE